MLEVPHELFDLISGECLPKCRHCPATFQNLLTQRILVLSAADSAEVWSLVAANPPDRVALKAPLLMKLCRPALVRGLTRTVPRERQSENQK